MIDCLSHSYNHLDSCETIPQKKNYRHGIATNYDSPLQKSASSNDYSLMYREGKKP